MQHALFERVASGYKAWYQPGLQLTRLGCHQIDTRPYQRRGRKLLQHMQMRMYGTQQHHLAWLVAPAVFQWHGLRVAVVYGAV